MRPLAGRRDGGSSGSATATRCCSMTGARPSVCRVRGDRRCRRARLLLNVIGLRRRRGALWRPRARSVFLDIDPGFGQMWRELGLHDVFADTTPSSRSARTIGAPDCSIPDLRDRMDHHAAAGPARQWPRRRGADEASRASAAGAARSSRSSTRARRYGLRAHELRSCVAAAGRWSRPSFELALDIDAGRRAATVEAAARERAGRWPIPRSSPATRCAYRRLHPGIAGRS